MLADWGVSIRRACRALPFDTSSYHYQSRRTDPAFLKKRIKEICETHVRYGYRRVYYILRRDGWVREPEEGLQALQGSWACSCVTRRPSGG
jgi:putative transposase